MVNDDKAAEVAQERIAQRVAHLLREKAADTPTTETHGLKTMDQADGSLGLWCPTCGIDKSFTKINPKTKTVEKTVTSPPKFDNITELLTNRKGHIDKDGHPDGSIVDCPGCTTEIVQLLEKKGYKVKKITGELQDIGKEDEEENPYTKETKE